jgi:hypothetical protein
MGAFKQFLSTDVTVVPFVVNKSFSFEGTASLSASGIFQYYGANVRYNSSQDISTTTGVNDGGTNMYWDYQPYNASLIWNSVKQLYYTNYIPTPNQSKAPTPVYDYNGNLIEDYTTTATNTRFYNYEQTSLFQTNSLTNIPYYGYGRYFRAPSTGATNVFVLSIPRNLFGDYINPKSFVYEANINGNDIYKWYDEFGEGIISQEIDGVLSYISRGTITYPHGTMVISNYTPGNGADFNNVTCSFQSSRTIYETQYKCTIRPDEFNYSLNPSLQPTGSAVFFSGSIWTNYTSSNNGTLIDFATGSYFSPYVTTIGLYNEAQELLAVAKLGQPLPTSNTTDTTILINIDR